MHRLLRADRSPRPRRLLPLRLAGLVLVAAAGLVALAGSAAGQEAGSLRETIEAAYGVSPSATGLALIPRQRELGVERIEVSGAEVLINGERVSQRVIEAWLGPRAAPILELAALSASEQRVLFELSTDDLPAPAEPAVAPPPVEVERDAEAGAEDDRDLEAEAPPAAPRVEPPPPPEPPRPAPTRRIGPQFVAFDDLRIEDDESASEAVALIGSVTVDGEVRGDVTAVMGSVYVEGRVDGEVVAVNGNVRLGPEAEVIKGVTAVGGRVDRDPGAVVRGAVNEVPFVPGLDIRSRGRDVEGWPRISFGGNRVFSGFWFFFWRLVAVAAFAILIAVAALVAPKTVGSISDRIREDAVKSGVAGLLTELLAVPALAVVVAVLILTCIGILFLPLLPLVIVAVCFVAYAGAAGVVGEALRRRLGRTRPSLGLAVLLGVLVLESPHVLASLFFSLPGLPYGVGWLTEGLADLVQFLAFTIGLGAFVLLRIESRRQRRSAQGGG